MYDLELIESWTPHEFFLLVKGRQHGIVDEMDRHKQLLFMDRYIANEKKPNEKKAYNADQNHKRIEETFQTQEYKDEKARQDERMRRITELFKGWNPSSFKKKEKK